jgi:hypothetical protein
MTLVYDPIVYQMHYFAIPGAREAARRKALVDFLNTATTQFASALNTVPSRKILELQDFAEEFIDPLTFVDHVQVPSGAVFELDARALHDAAMLRTSAMLKGGFPLEKVKELFAVALPEPEKGLASYLGMFRVLYVETDVQPPSNWVKVGRAIAGAFGWKWLAQAQPIDTPAGMMLFGVQPRLPYKPATPTLDLLFVGERRDETKEEEGQPPHPLLFTIPELALCHLKVRNSAENLRYHRLGELADYDRQLREILPRDEVVEHDLYQMLDRNDELTARQARLVDALAHVQLELRTMHINRDNFDAAARSFNQAAGELKQQLIDRWMRPMEAQAENDMGYINGTLQRADNHFKSIAASAAAHQARELKTITRWQIFLTVVGVAIAVLGLPLAALSVYLAWPGIK